ncbi:MAG: hypothetical protein AAF821_10915 [Cyanobacteria bacterium P01_D01_bin.156]
MRSIVLLLSITPLLLGCTLQSEPAEPIPSTPMVEAPSDALPTNIQTQIRTDLANYLNIRTDQITIQTYSRRTWSDGCLGLGGPAELCLAALTKGWQAEAIDTTTNTPYIYRTNLTGDQIRREL